MTEHFDRIVVGGGAMGLAATWQLASRGARTLMLERFAPGHARGASHGATRNMNNAYAQPHYLDLYDEALALWRELETSSDRRLLHLEGLVTHGDQLRVRRAHDHLDARGARAEMITAAAAGQRWPGMKFDGDVLMSRDAGRIDSATTLQVLAELSRRSGAVLHYGHRVTGIETGGDRVSVRVQAPNDEELVFEADGAVVAVGAWSRPMLEGLVDLPPLRVTEEHPAHFDVGAAFAAVEWPSFNHFRPSDRLEGFQGNVYGMLTPGEGVKVGFHATGLEVDPEHRRFRAPDEARAQLRDYVAEWFPGLDADSAVELSCTYTMTPSEDFVLDRQGPLTVAAGFSGHGFKFVPAVGRVLADASLGVMDPPDPFLLRSHR